jgi:hypothetical protein
LERFPRGTVDGEAGALALIEIPPFDRSVRTGASESSGCIIGRLSDAEKWFVETPVEIRLAESYVVAVAEPGRENDHDALIPSRTRRDGPKGSNAPYASTQPDCGPACVYLCCRLAGIACSWESVREATSPSGAGVTMLSLKRAAESYGFRVRACRLGWDRLCNEIRSQETYAILHVSGGHFVTVVGIGAEGLLRIADPWGRLAEYDEQDLYRLYRWQGNSLLLAAPVGSGNTRPESGIQGTL